MSLEACVLPGRCYRRMIPSCDPSFRPAPLPSSSPTSRARRRCSASWARRSTHRRSPTTDRSSGTACTRNGGVEVDTQGDAFFFAFPTANGALGAASDFTERLAANGPIRVRVGVHTGAPLIGDEGYVGHDVHRAARIAAAGHGGQVLVSASTASLVESELTDLGEHRFKDLAAPRTCLPARRRRVPRPEEPLPDEPSDPGDRLPRSRTRAPGGR